MELKYELTQRDFLDCFIAHRNRSGTTKWFLCLVVFLSFIMLGFGLVSFATRPQTQSVSSLAMMCGVAALWSFVMWGAPRLTARNQFSKQPGAHGPRTAMLDAVGVHWRWSGGSADIEWKNFIRFYEAKNQFLFYTSPVCFNIVPKRALNEEQIRQFRALLAQNLSEPKTAAPARPGSAESTP